MKKVIKILKLIVYYIAVFVFSSIGFNAMPIGAIAMVSAIYASEGILALVIVLSMISTVVFLGIKSLLILILFLILFLVPVIFIRPLISIEGRNEKKKIGNYLIISSFLSFVFFGFLNGILSVIITYILYKIFVNTMAVLKNEDEKEVFSKEENIALYTFLSIGLLYISTYFKIPIIFPSILIFGILGYASIKNGFFDALLSYIFTISIFIFIIISAMNVNINFDLTFNNMLLMFIPIIVFALVSLLRRFTKFVTYISVSLINIGLFFLFYKYFETPLYYLPYFLMSVVVIIFAEDYARIKDKKTRNASFISDEGETRLETPFYTDEKEEKKEILKSREVIELFTDKDIFVNRMYINEDAYKDLSLYDEIQSSDYIFEELYDLISKDGYIERKKFNNILLKNNIVIDIYSYEVEEEIRILEILSLRELKRVIREREEKEVFKEREEALQNNKKTDLGIEETDSIDYNKSATSINKNKSIRDIFQKKIEKEENKENKEKNKEENQNQKDS